jgi:hypothetical protein
LRHALAKNPENNYFTFSEKESAMCRCGFLAVLLLISCPVWAQAPEAPPMPQTREQAAAQRAQANSRRAEAQRVYTQEQNACYKKFLVNSCLDEAKKKHTQAVIDARNFEKPAREFLHAEDRRDLEAKEAKRASDLVTRQASQKEQAANYRQEEAAKAIARDEKQAAKTRQAEEGRKKTADEQAKRKAKLQKRAQKDAERAVKREAKAQKQAERDAKKAAKAEAVPAN